jgi:hypothetical protein
LITSKFSHAPPPRLLYLVLFANVAHVFNRQATIDDPVVGRSFACPKAKIIAIHKIPGKVIKRNQKAMLKLAHKNDRERAAKGLV